MAGNLIVVIRHSQGKVGTVDDKKETTDPQTYHLRLRQPQILMNAGMKAVFHELKPLVSEFWETLRPSQQCHCLQDAAMISQLPPPPQNRNISVQKDRVLTVMFCRAGSSSAAHSK